jgi:hypothetical protein
MVPIDAWKARWPPPTCPKPGGTTCCSSTSSGRIRPLLHLPVTQRRERQQRGLPCGFRPLRLQSEAADREVANVEDKLRLQVQTARLVADAAARIKFDNIGVITDVTSTQPGDKIQANAPLGGIAPKNARPILKIEIAEHDRAFLREGLPVRLKFNALPYQRYGVIRGTLQYISRRPSRRCRPSSRCTKGGSRWSRTSTRWVTLRTRYVMR